MAKMTDRELAEEIFSFLIDIDARLKIVEEEAFDIKAKATVPDTKLTLLDHQAKIKEYYEETKKDIERRYPGHTIRPRS